MSDNGLTEYLKQRVEALKKRNNELTRLKEYVLKQHPNVYKQYKGSK